MVDEWYSYTVFRFTREQVLWALANKKIFELGEWVMVPGEYLTDEYDKESKKWIKVVKTKKYNVATPITQRQMKGDAYFVRPKIIMGEINYRLKLTGIDGKLLLAEIKGGIERYEDLDYESKMALNYVSGWRRRRQFYVDFKKQRRYRRENEYQKVSPTTT